MSEKTFTKLFDTLYDKLHSLYFSRNGIPYHSIETCVVEAPSHGHESTSEAVSFYVFVEALRGYRTGDWKPLENAWKALEFFIPDDQESYEDYNPSKPAEYAAEQDRPSEYPVEFDRSVRAGNDPVAAKLTTKYGGPIYNMHWLADPDNVWGFGPLFNTFQRGPLEGVWFTIPQPCVDDLTHGGKNGYLDLFLKQDGPSPAQWKYTAASDADARAIQAVFFVDWLCRNKQKEGPPKHILEKATKLGDYLAYAMFDKYFLKIGTQSRKQRADGQEDAFHGLLSWYHAWGGPLQRQGWAFHISCSHSHAGYQNPYTAYEMSQNPSSIMKNEWKTSLDRQLELFAWLQSSEGAISGGCTNSWNGRYEDYPDDIPTFYGMAYVSHPVYLSPPSNEWSGMNAWGMERVLMYYYVTRDSKIQSLVSKWCHWVASNIVYKSQSKKVFVPAKLVWTGEPDVNWNGGGFPSGNTRLHCKIAAHSQDIGVTACFARCLLLYTAVHMDEKLSKAANLLLGALLTYEDSKGYSVPEKRPDYANFDAPVYVPSGWTGKTPLGDMVDSNATFLSLRKSVFEPDNMYKKIRKDLQAGTVPTIRVHRFWAASEILITFAVADMLNCKVTTLS